MVNANAEYLPECSIRDDSPSVVSDKKNDNFMGNTVYNGLQLPEGGDFEALHCQFSTIVN